MLYFAYGTNMDVEQMRNRCQDGFSVLGAATLNDYEVVEQKDYPNIRPKEKSKVSGTLFGINEACLVKLDEYEEYLDLYERREVEVVDEKNKSVKALVYIQQ